MRGDPAAKVDKLGNGTPGLVGMLGGPSRPMTPGNSPLKLKRRLGGGAPAAPLMAYRSVEPVVPDAYVPDTYVSPGENSGPSADAPGEGTGGPSGEGGDA